MLTACRGKNGSATGNATVDLLLAMTQQRLGHTVEAAATLSAAVETIERFPKTPEIGDDGIENWLICQIIRREAEGLIKGKVTVLPATQPAASRPAASQP